MRYGSVCSGIEAATVAWHGLGWEPSFFSEIEAFPRAVLQHHYPDVPLHGDFTTIAEDDYEPIELLVGGTPCQSFSVAGLRGGMADDRGNLALEYLRLARRTRSKWLVWENVPGVLSSNGGRDFGSILGGLVELGYGFAYRVLDAQYIRTHDYPRAVPQRRRRVFVVGCLGDWRRAAAVLFERESLSGDSPPRREVGKRNAASLTACTNERSNQRLFSQRGDNLICTPDVAPNGGGANGPGRSADDAESLVPDVSPTIKARDYKGPNSNIGEGQPILPVAHTLRAEYDSVRRLTPRECERLQGFPDDYTQIPYRNKDADQCPDGPRYKALGNSMAVNVMQWIGQRIKIVDEM